MKDKKLDNWYYILELGKNDKGKRVRKKKRGFKKQKDAKKALNEAIMAANSEPSIQPPNEQKTMTLASYLDYWLENYAKTNTRPKTFAEYSKIVQKHLIPALGNILISELTSLQLQEYYSQKVKVLSKRTVLHQHRLLSKSLNDAVEWEFLIRNVAKKAKPPKPDRLKMKTLNGDQLNLLLDSAKETSPIYFPAISTATQTGMRMSEVLGLRWEDVDFKNNRLHIQQTITNANGKLFFNNITKNGTTRSISMNKNHAKMLRELKAEQDKLKKELGNTFNPHNLVHVNSIGNIISSSELTRAFKRALKKANLPDIRFHDLRHSHATILLEKKVLSKVVSSRLGHTKTAITMDLYSHVTPSIEEQAVSELDKIFG